jgi:hypothetical protein
LEETKLHYPVVRFLTDKKEWITTELSIGSNPPMEEGRQLTVRYDPNHPETVEIDSAARPEITPRVFVGLGVFVVPLTLTQLFDIIEPFN